MTRRAPDRNVVIWDKLPGVDKWQQWDDNDPRWFDMNGAHVDDLGIDREHWVSLNRGYKRPIEGIEEYPVKDNRIKAKRTIYPKHPLWDFLEQESYCHWAREIIVGLDTSQDDEAFKKYAKGFVGYIDDIMDAREAQRRAKAKKPTTKRTTRKN